MFVKYVLCTVLILLLASHTEKGILQQLNSMLRMFCDKPAPICIQTWVELRNINSVSVKERARKKIHCEITHYKISETLTISCTLPRVPLLPSVPIKTQWQPNEFAHYYACNRWKHIVYICQSLLYRFWQNIFFSLRKERNRTFLAQPEEFVFLHRNIFFL